MFVLRRFPPHRRAELLRVSSDSESSQILLNYKSSLSANILSTISSPLCFSLSILAVKLTIIIILITIIRPTIHSVLYQADVPVRSTLSGGATHHEFRACFSSQPSTAVHNYGRTTKLQNGITVENLRLCVLLKIFLQFTLPRLLPVVCKFCWIGVMFNESLYILHLNLHSQDTCTCTHQPCTYLM